PNIAPKAYALRFFAPLSSDLIDSYQSIHNIRVSSYYLPILQKLNGAHAFELSLFGIPPSMASDPPLLDRSVAQPLDIGTANTVWKRGYAVEKDWFHFGGGPYTFDENIGYFFDQSGTIHSMRKSGKSLGSWRTFKQFLVDELARAEAAYSE
ncbi:MAG: hypothetical protein ACREDR_23375, partial [Blastocatellia bacterium]